MELCEMSLDQRRQTKRRSKIDGWSHHTRYSKMMSNISSGRVWTEEGEPRVDCAVKIVSRHS